MPTICDVGLKSKTLSTFYFYLKLCLVYFEINVDQSSDSLTRSGETDKIWLFITIADKFNVCSKVMDGVNGFGDVTLVCDDDKRIQAHEVVKLARSGYILQLLSKLIFSLYHNNFGVKLLGSPI